MRRVWMFCIAVGLCIGFAQAAYAETMSFNKASAEEIERVSEGLVDNELAKAIVAYREKNGPFKSPEDLQSVPGMKSIIFNSLEPELKDGDVVYSTEVKGGMKAY